MKREDIIKQLKSMDEFAHVCEGEDFEAIRSAIKIVETGEVYMTAEDYNLFLEGYKEGMGDYKKIVEENERLTQEIKRLKKAAAIKE